MKKKDKIIFEAINKASFYYPSGESQGYEHTPDHIYRERNAFKLGVEWLLSNYNIEELKEMDYQAKINRLNDL